METKLKNIVEEILSSFPDIFLVKFQLIENKIKLFVDSISSVSIDQCVSVSRALSKRIESDTSMMNMFSIEVSSPGLDSPLVHPLQFEKNKGKNIKVVLKQGNTIEGLLVDRNEKKLTVQDKNSEMNIELENIKKVTLQISF